MNETEKELWDKCERLKIAVRDHEAYAHMMQEQRSQMANYCRLLEKQVEYLRTRFPEIK